MKSKKTETKNNDVKDTKPIHRWRLCPAGEHWVRPYERRVKVSTSNPLGITDVIGHCARNPTGLDQLYPDEIQEIASRNFESLLLQPNSDRLRFEKGSDYDILIAGWTQYWNDIFRPAEILQPNLVKALIASESGFRSHIKIKSGKNDFARGLMQITDKTRIALSDEDGELSDHLVTITDEEAYDPNLNICAGIRWLFRKKEIAETRAGKNVSWDRVIYLYKAAQKNPDVMTKFRNYLQRLNSSEPKVESR